MKNLLVLIFLLTLSVLKAQNFNVKFYTEKAGQTFQIYADNAEFSPMSVTFDFTLENMKSSLQKTQLTVIPAQTKKFLIATLEQIDPKKKYSFKYRNSFNFGNVEQISYDENYIYSLPFEKGKSQSVYQGYDGSFSHQNQKALDFDLKTGDKIYAARGGKVIKVETGFDKNCISPECGAFNNQIIIVHLDGTFAEYLHLVKNGSPLKAGEIVEQGQFIGNSGNTGWSKGPHLHFSVYLNRMDGQRFYIPTKFKTENSAGEILQEKKAYKRIF